MIHSDICDWKSALSRGGNKSFILFVDDCTKYYYVYFIKSKDNENDRFKIYEDSWDTMERENHNNAKIS